MGIFNDNSQNLSGGKGPAGRDGIGFKLTDDGNYDIDGKRLTNLAEPKDNSDASPKNYVDTKNTQQDTAINSKAEKADVIFARWNPKYERKFRYGKR